MHLGVEARGRDVRPLASEHLVDEVVVANGQLAERDVEVLQRDLPATLTHASTRRITLKR